MVKTKKDAKAAIRDAIAATPTASDAQIASTVGEDRDDVDRFLVADVRSEMGAKHTWKGAKS